jgi:hypothetical protein
LKSQLFAFAAAITVLAAPAFAQPFSEPQPVPMPPSTPAPKDVAYPGGMLRISVDATDLDRRIFEVRETIPLASGGAQTAW